MTASLSAIIVDDELHARENLRIMLSSFCPEINLIGEAGNIITAEEAIYKLQPEVVFLDIRMPSGSEGFDLLKKIGTCKFQVVFVTAFKDYAIKAFKANAVHYILKPIDIDDLLAAVQKLITNQIQFNNNPENYNTYSKVLENATASVDAKKSTGKFTIHHAKGFKLINEKDVLYLEGAGNCTLLYFLDGSTYLDTRTLKIYEEILSENMFYRIHKSHIVNLRYLKEYVHEDGHMIRLSNNVELYVSRHRLTDLKQIISNL